MSDFKPVQSGSFVPGYRKYLSPKTRTLHMLNKICELFFFMEFDMLTENIRGCA